MTGIILIFCIVTGFIVGKLLLRINHRSSYKMIMKFVSHGQHISIYILLFMMGFKTGGTREVIENFQSLGFHSFLYGILMMLCSAAIAYLLTIVFRSRLQSAIHTDSSNTPNEPNDTHYGMIAVFLGLVILGGVIGYFHLLPLTKGLIAGTVDYSLFFLVFFIGIDIGAMALEISHFKSIIRQVLITCSGVILGSFLGALICGLILGYDMIFSIAIGSGMGWYSLAGVLLSSIDETLGAVAFSANLVRELSAIAMVPILGRFLHAHAAVAACGATAMDTTLPAIMKGLGRQYTLVGFACGMIISSLVPLFLSVIQIIYGIM